MAAKLRSVGGCRAGFQAAGSSGILPEVSGMMRRSNTDSRLEAAATGRQDAYPTALEIWRGTKGRMFAPGSSVGTLLRACHFHRPPLLSPTNRVYEHCNPLQTVPHDGAGNRHLGCLA